MKLYNVFIAVLVPLLTGTGSTTATTPVEEVCGSGLLTDDFNSGSLNSVWTKVSGGGETSGGHLNLEVGDAVAANFWKNDQVNNVPRVYQSLSSDGPFTVKVTFNTEVLPVIDEKFNDLGVFLRFGGDDRKFYRISVFTDGSGGDNFKFFIARIEGSTSGPSWIVGKSSFPSYVKVERTTSPNQFSVDFGGLQSKTVTISDALDGVGLFAANGGTAGTQPGFTGSFDKFELECPGGEEGPTVRNGDDDAGAKADPHFKTFNGRWFDYHGECDLVLLDVPHFGFGEGLTIHLRTTIRQSYSYIETAAVKIGSDILQVSSYGFYMLNGIADAQMPATMAGYPVHYTLVNDQQHSFQIQLDEYDNNGQAVIWIKTFKDFVSVKVQHAHHPDFRTSVGMMGNFTTGAMLARNGTTVLDDPTAFGQEWQVRPTKEPLLFETSLRNPQYPEPCRMPDDTQTKINLRGRSLQENAVRMEDAQAACAHIIAGEGPEMEACVFDVMATGDLEMAQAGSF